MKINKGRLAIIGSGPTAIYILKHLYDHAAVIGRELSELTIFEKTGILGMGMPYSPETTDIHNLANISSEEIPALCESFGNWLRGQDVELLESLNVTNLPIDDSQVYSRLALGRYLREQYVTLIERLRSKDIAVEEASRHRISDIVHVAGTNKVELVDSTGKSHFFSKVIIATGHEWEEPNRQESGYYSSPWPIHRLLPGEGEHHDFTIGTLGASLSAFDVVTSLAHRHGKFIEDGAGLTFRPDPDAPKFKVAMHSAEGWLPHLQYEQVEPIREIYRHTDRKTMLCLRDASGFLRIATFFDKVCRPALSEAFTKDGDWDMAQKLRKKAFKFSDFVRIMSERHEYSESFEGMRKEMEAARDSLENHRPIHWKETLDDLMYCLNFHAELLPAEDHLFFRKEVMTFLMNVIAALPLSSARILLALYDSGTIELIPGKVKVRNSSRKSEKTLVEVEGHDGSVKTLEYRMFVNCSGHKGVEFEEYPFPTLVRSGRVREARAEFAAAASDERPDDLSDGERISYENGSRFLHIIGIDVDAAYRVIGTDGRPNELIHDVNFTHTSGSRPYSYGLQACCATSEILVDAWQSSIDEGTEIKTDIVNITDLYMENEDL